MKVKPCWPQTTDNICKCILSSDAPIIGIGRLAAVLPIIGIGQLVYWYRPIVVFALCGLHVTEIKFMYASMYVIC